MSQFPVYGGVQNRQRQQARPATQPWQNTKIIGESGGHIMNHRKPATTQQQLIKIGRVVALVLVTATFAKLVWWTWFVI